MSRCGNCRSNQCTCFLQGDGVTTTVSGNGSTYQPFRAREISPNPRSVGCVRRIGGGSQSITANTDTAIIFNVSDSILPSGQNMWDPLLPTRLTVTVPGLYLIGGACHQVNDGGTGQLWSIWIARNGVSASPLVRRTVSTNAGGPGYLHLNDVMSLYRFSVGDYIELYVRSDRTAGTATTGGPNSPGTFIPAYPYLYANWMDD